MKLRQFSLWFSVLVLTALSANTLFLLMIQRANDSVVAVQAHRQHAMVLVDELRQETEQLTQLVRAYTSTGRTNYLTFYYDLLAIREGQKPQPEGYIPGAYWDMAIAGSIPYRFPPNGERRSLSDRMRLLGFNKNEFIELGRISLATEAMKQVEQVAFAATQGLYDPATEKFVSDGKPDLAFASKLVHSRKYNELKSNLAQSVRELVFMVDQRTNTSVDQATRDLQGWIYATLCSVLFTIGMVLVAFRVTRTRVLQPIEQLSRAASRLARGDYSTRTGTPLNKAASISPLTRLRESDSAGWVEELTAFGTTFDVMADSIEQDIKLRQQVQGELESANLKAEEATKAKSMFLANMSHEIRTPMNAIVGMAYLALKTELSPKQKDYLDKVHNAAKSLLGILNDILDFSKIEAGKLELEQARFRLEDVICNSLTMLRQPAIEKEIELLLDISGPQVMELSNVLIGDSLRLGQIVTNLLSNAVKFTHQGYVKLAIVVETQSQDSVSLRFSVEDTGIGMTEEQIGRLFQEFTQADGTITRHYGGTGLGLAITKKLVEAMGGRIQVESAEGKGTNFSFSLRFPISLPAPLPPFRVGQERMRVLVVDDHPEARQVLCGLLTALRVGEELRPQGVEAAENGERALTMLRAADANGTPYDLLLFDWVMPTMDGAQLLEMIALSGLTVPPVTAVVSAYDTDAVRAAARNLPQCTLFFAKPVLPEMLRSLLKQLTGPGTDSSGAEDAFALGPMLDGMRVLLVEDHRINRQLAVELLESKGVAVEVAVNGQHALDCITGQPHDYFDLVLMDLQMPVLDGFGATRCLREKRRYDDLPIVAMSAHAMTEERELCRSKGMQGHICKPVEPELLFATLAHYYPKRPSEPAPSTAGPATPPPAPQTSASIPHIEGLDTVAGLRRAGNKTELYLWVLNNFLAEYAAAPAQIELAVAQKRWEDAERLAHTVKGLLGTIGAPHLQESAANLEQALRARQTGWSRSLLQLSAGFTPLVSALRSSLPNESTESDPAKTILNAEASSWFGDFATLLGDGDYHAAVLWEARWSELRGLFSDETITGISRALEEFDFARAKVLAEAAAPCDTNRAGETP